MSAVAFDLRGTRGFLVADVAGRLVGRVECPMYGTTPDEPDALSVRTGFFARRRRLVPAAGAGPAARHAAPRSGGRQARSAGLRESG